MAESKRIFVTGRMNKDLDERLVQNGEYRDAMNVEVVSSEGSNVGSLQNLLGNTEQKIKDKDNNEWDFSQGITGGDQAWLDFYDANVNQEGEVSMVTDDDANNVSSVVSLGGITPINIPENTWEADWLPITLLTDGNIRECMDFIGVAMGALKKRKKTRRKSDKSKKKKSSKSGSTKSKKNKKAKKKKVVRGKKSRTSRK